MKLINLILIAFTVILISGCSYIQQFREAPLGETEEEEPFISIIQEDEITQETQNKGEVAEEEEIAELPEIVKEEVPEKAPAVIEEEKTAENIKEKDYGMYDLIYFLLDLAKFRKDKAEFDGLCKKYKGFVAMSAVNIYNRIIFCSSFAVDLCLHRNEVPSRSTINVGYSHARARFIVSKAPCNFILEVLHV